MQDVLNSLQQAHEQLKALAIQAIQSETEIEQHVLDSLKATRALIAAVRQATGL